MFEGGYIRRNVRLDAVEAAMPAPSMEGFQMKPSIVAYLKTGVAQVVPFYRLEKAGAFAEGDARGAAFATERVAAGAAELRDLTIQAWQASETATIGWPAVKVADVQAGTVDPWASLYGED
jgi:hypothetical protein